MTPAMIHVIWQIADYLDKQRIPATPTNAVWVEIPTAKLRGDGGRNDNVWLRECLRRIRLLELTGEYRGEPWGGGMLGEWRIVQGGAVARLNIPPGAVAAYRLPDTFAKIEATAAFQLPGHARRLYALLADRKRQARPSWTYSLEELRRAMGVEDRRSYQRFNSFRQRVLDPALKAIEDFGTVDVEMIPHKVGRAVSEVEFRWRWKSLDAARETSEANDRHSSVRRKAQSVNDAPPMIEEPSHDDQAQDWWRSLTDAERQGWTKRVGATSWERKEEHLAAHAYRLSLDGRGPL